MFFCFIILLGQYIFALLLTDLFGWLVRDGSAKQLLAVDPSQTLFAVDHSSAKASLMTPNKLGEEALACYRS